MSVLEYLEEAEEKNMTKVKHVMTTNVVTVRKDTPISRATELLMSNHITGMPVVEEDMTLVGVISEKDVLNLFYSSGQTTNRTVSDFMTTPAVHFDQEEDLQDVCACLMENSFRRVPVTLNGRVVGVVSRCDVLEYMSRGDHDPSGEQKPLELTSAPPHGQ
ncbi:MAG: CBS domain-containing protein [Sedimentisphaerales bacterium]|nr:CBS domain-containing protein [Sedimentisphaerales bacterium]